MEGNANFAGLYWKQLEQWADYLKDKGFDPEQAALHRRLRRSPGAQCQPQRQGHLRPRARLPSSGDMRGDKAKSDEYFKLAREFAAQWVKEADDGEKFRLAFDRPGTWSQKYNLMWDRILGLNLFPDSVLRKEMDYYKKIQNKYGLPLDSRKEYTKLDWITWTATLTANARTSSVDRPDLHLHERDARSFAAHCDWYETKTAKKVGFTARATGHRRRVRPDALRQGDLGEVCGRDKTKAANFAPMPKAPCLMNVLPTAVEERPRWRYTTTKPSADWFKPEFDAGAWKEGAAGFGTRGTYAGSRVRTEWNTSDIWLRASSRCRTPSSATCN